VSVAFLLTVSILSMQSLSVGPWFTCSQKHFEISIPVDEGFT